MSAAIISRADLRHRSDAVEAVGQGGELRSETPPPLPLRLEPSHGSFSAERRVSGDRQDVGATASQRLSSSRISVDALALQGLALPW